MRVLFDMHLMFSHMRRDLASTAAELAVTYPEAWVFSWSLLGLITGVIGWSAIGFCLGSLMGHALVGSWCGLGFYAYFLASNADVLNARMDIWVDQLKQLR